MEHKQFLYLLFLASLFVAILNFALAIWQMERGNWGWVLWDIGMTTWCAFSAFRVMEMILKLTRLRPHPEEGQERD